MPSWIRGSCRERHCSIGALNAVCRATVLLCYCAIDASLRFVPRRITFEVEDEAYRTAKVLATESDTSLSGAMRALVHLWESDKKVQARVRAEADPVRRQTRVGSQE
jgi:hypothetical protein